MNEAVKRTLEDVVIGAVVFCVAIALLLGGFIGLLYIHVILGLLYPCVIAVCLIVLNIRMIYKKHKYNLTHSDAKWIGPQGWRNKK
jgi:uncharacterized membrane protein YfcA